MEVQDEVEILVDPAEDWAQVRAGLDLGLEPAAEVPDEEKEDRAED